jgi:hypothetical protein
VILLSISEDNPRFDLLNENGTHLILVESGGGDRFRAVRLAETLILNSSSFFARTRHIICEMADLFRRISNILAPNAPVTTVRT